MELDEEKRRLERQKYWRDYWKWIRETREKIAPFIRENNKRYKEKGKKKRCRFAHPTECPHYFQSTRVIRREYYYIGKEEISESKQIEQLWKDAGIWYLSTDKQPDASSYNFSVTEDVCPEASFESPDHCLANGIYATEIVQYDEGPKIYIDNETNKVIEFPPSIIEVHRQLKESNAPPEDWRWYFEKVEEMHFSECPFYNRLKGKRVVLKVNFDIKENHVSPILPQVEQKQVESTIDNTTKLSAAVTDIEDRKNLAERDNVFMKEESVWQMSFQGETIHIPDKIGFAYIAYLLERGGKEVPVEELAFAVAKPDPTDLSEKQLEEEGLRKPSEKVEDIGDTLDLRAIREYQEALKDAKDRIEIAKEMGDEGRLAELQDQIDFIAKELSSATGLDGRSRKLDKTDDKLRNTIRKSIKDGIDKIKLQHIPLAEHLDKHVHTGSKCRYTPPDPIRWKVR